MEVSILSICFCLFMMSIILGIVIVYIVDKKLSNVVVKVPRLEPIVIKTDLMQLCIFKHPQWPLDQPYSQPTWEYDISPDGYKAVAATTINTNDTIETDSAELYWMVLTGDCCANKMQVQHSLPPILS